MHKMSIILAKFKIYGRSLASSYLIFCPSVRME